MKSLLTTMLLLGASAASGADTIAQLYDSDVVRVEREILPLVQAMPADKFNFAPTNGTFTGVRTFGLQARHIATEIYRVSAAVLGEKPPDLGPTDNGPDSLKTKDQIVEYFKGAVALAHRAANSLTVQNQLDMVPSPYGGPPVTRVSLA